VIRRETAYVIEERIKVIVDGRKELTGSLVDRVSGCQGPASYSRKFTDYLDAAWPESQSLVSVLPKGATHGVSSTWHNTSSFAGIVADRGSLEIRSFRSVEREGCSVTILVRNPVDASFLEQLSRAAGLQISSSKPVLLGPYRAAEGIRGEIEANFIPGSRRPVPVVVIARNWQTGQLEDWVVCQVRPSYSRTIEDLSHMGLRTASWGRAVWCYLAWAGKRVCLRLVSLSSPGATDCERNRRIESRCAPDRERRFLGQSRGSRARTIGDIGCIFQCDDPRS